MTWLAWVGVVIGALIVTCTAAMIWLGMGVAGEDYDEGGHR